MNRSGQERSRAIAGRLKILPCGYDSQVGNARVAREFVSEVAADSPDTGLKMLEMASRVLDLDNPQARKLRTAFEDRLAVEILIHAVAGDFAHGGTATVNWWPVADGMKAGDELLLLLSPAPIPFEYAEALARHDGYVSRSRTLDAIVGTAKRYGSLVPPSCFDDVRLSPFRFITGGGLVGRGRMLDDPTANGDGKLEAPIGEVHLLAAAVNPTLLNLPSSWSEEWDIDGEAVADMEFVSESDLDAAVEKTLNPDVEADARRAVLELEPEPGHFRVSLKPPGGWQIDELVAKGGQGTCYRASRGSERATLKLIRRGDKAEGRADTTRPMAIVELGRQFPHDGIGWYLEVLGDDTNGEGTWVLLEDRGDSLALRSYEMSLAEKLSALIQVGHALAFLHANGIAWIDVKPENIVVSEDGRATLVDPDLVSDGRRSGTPFHMPATSNPDCELDIYAFIGTIIRVLLSNQVTANGAGIRLGDHYPEADPLAKRGVVEATGLGDFSLGPNACAKGVRASTEVEHETFPGTLDSVLQILETAHDRSAELGQASSFEAELATQLTE